MRILFVTGAFPVPSETFVYGMIKGMREQGAEVRILAFDDGRHERNCPFRMDAQILGKVWRGRQTGSGKWKRFLAWVDIARTGTIPWRQFLCLLPPAFSDRAQCYQTYYSLAEALLAMPPFDIVHAQFGHWGRMLGELKRVGILRAPLVTTFHGGDTTIFMRRYPDGYKKLYAQADLLLAVSEKLRKWHLDAGCDPELVETFYDVIDIRDWPYMERHAGVPINLLTVGRLVEKKGIEYCIDALAELQKWGVEATLNVAGDGPLLASLQEHAHSRGVGGKVNMLGWKTREEIQVLMRSAHVFLCCSVTACDGDEEGIPNTLKEAMASGLPIIASRHAGIPEIIVDGVTGRLVDERNGYQVAVAVRDLIENPAAFHKMAQAARLHIEEKHEVERLCEILLEKFHFLLKRSKNESNR